MDWQIEGVDYWHNPHCPKEYLEGALVRLIAFVEGEDLPIDHFKNTSREYLVDRISFYEYVADK